MMPFRPSVSKLAVGITQSSIELGPAMKARIAENGFFMFCVNDNKDGGVELSDPQTPLVELGLKAKGK
jgi:hypothetical protein